MNSGYSLNEHCWIIYSQLQKRITINFLTFLRQIQHSISLIIQGLKDCLSNIQLMYRILRHGSRIRGLLEEYSQVIPCTRLKFKHTLDPLCWRGWSSQIWHCLYIRYNAQFWQAAADYYHMIALQACLWTMPTYFASPLNGIFCSIPSIFLPFCLRWICGCQHKLSVHRTDTKLASAAATHPGRPQQISEAMLDQYVKAADKLPLLSCSVSTHLLEEGVHHTLTINTQPCAISNHTWVDFD